MELGTAIKTLRKSKKMGQRDLSNLCDLSINALSQIETNQTFPHKNNIEKICAALDVPVSYLLFLSISEDDLPEDKKEIFNALNEPIKKLLIS